MTVRQLIPEGLGEIAPGPELGVLLAGIDVHALTGADTVEVLRARARQLSHDQARLLAVMVEVGSWTALRDAGFPPVEAHGCDPDDIEAEGLGHAPDSWEQLQLDIPGLKQVLKAGRAVPLVKGDRGAKVADVTAYVDMIEQMHHNFGKTVDAARESLATMREGCGGDETANAVDAWEAGIDGSNEPEADEPADRSTPVLVSA